MSKLTSRVLTSKDYEAAGRLMVACGGPSNTDEPGHKNHLTLAAMVGRKAVGLIVVRVRDEFAELLYVGVVASRRRQGVATFLLAEVQKIPSVAQAGWLRSWVELSNDNVPAMKWLKARGFHGSAEDDVVRFGLRLKSEPILIEV